MNPFTRPRHKLEDNSKTSLEEIVYQVAYQSVEQLGNGPPVLRNGG
jgi:hypothetical protein